MNVSHVLHMSAVSAHEVAIHDENRFLLAFDLAVAGTLMHKAAARDSLATLMHMHYNGRMGYKHSDLVQKRATHSSLICSGIKCAG